MADTHENGAEAPTNQPSATGDNVRSTAIPEDPGAQRNPPSGTFFGLNRNQMHSWGVGAAPRDYKARYPLDPHGQEMSDKARIWSIYLDEAADFDANMLAEWRDTIDVLLVFAGLFSAVLTTFVVQTSQNMQPDYNQASAFIFFQILNATMSNGSQFSIPSSPTAFNFSPSRSDEWLNSLWFVSLTLSLITALVAVLVKQWLHQYVAIVSDSSPRDRARIRHMRYAALQAWQVPMIIGMLPVLLHVSLALFFAGLAIFLFSLGMKVAWLVSIIGTATYMAYISALILPLVYPYCPFKVPLTLYVHSLYQFASDSLIPRIALIRHYPYTHVFGRGNHRLRMYQRARESIFRHQKRSLKETEHDHVQKCAKKVDAQSLQWLHSSTSNASVHQSVLQAFSGMTSTTLKCLSGEYRSAFVGSLYQQIEQMESLVLSPGAERELELYHRAFVLLRPYQHVFKLSFLSDRDHMALMADRCSNEQLKMVLWSFTSSEKATSVLLGILQGPQRSSLTLHSAVWKALVNAAIPFPHRLGSVVPKLELELMKIIATRPRPTGESGDVTTIDKPTDEMREYIFTKLLAYWATPPYLGSLYSDSDQRIILVLYQIEYRLRDPVFASDRKQLIENFLTIIERIDNLLYCLGISAIGTVLHILYSLLSSDAFAVVSPDLETLALKIFIILDRYQPWIEDSIPPNMRFYSVAYQCYFHSLVGSGERSENDVMPCALGRLILSSLNLPPASSMDDSESHETPLDPLQYPFFSINGLFQVMLLLIREHNESVLYEWVRYPAMQNVWPECLSRLVRWASGEQFRQWDLLRRVLAVVVIGELQNMVGHRDDGESLPQYDYDVYKDVDQLPWLYEVAGSSGDGNLEYSQIAAHPKFQEFLHCKRPTQEITGDAGSPAVSRESS
ncbi:uncharacterized protein ARMOST_15935 [Armillaria ostoyae]|uniref:DUF6535 domain-containing protein n=1 Tax=Armillaria ostoyae TaxID=47428 RepID=A0A284RUS6_ARMOS|nr:uncharacterized protein ARMOST_15935 [Armillaria ostoyae]